jgi:nucleotide-binding universal stress UspA family protein
LRKLRNILVSTDFSSASRQAFRTAVELAAASDARLWIAHVIPAIPAGRLPRMYQGMDAFLQAEADKRLRALTGAARAKGAAARALALRGFPHEAVRRAARAHRVDLIVLGTHGRTGVGRALLGSVATRIIATAPCPVLSVARRRGGAKARRVLFATDFSEASGPAWRDALQLARANQARLRILHVWAPLARGQGARWAYAEAEREIRADAWRRLQALLRNARRAGVRAEAVLLPGAPHEAIARSARSLRDAWIVVGTHGRTGLAGAILGSVAMRVVAAAPCPVLTIRAARRP